MKDTYWQHKKNIYTSKQGIIKFAQLEQEWQLIKEGNIIDRDYFRYDLAERHNILLVECDK